MNGSSVPQTIIDLARQKTTTAFVDGDRGGDLNIQELLQVSDLDFITKAPEGKEVEELTQKEIHKCLRSRISAEQAKHEFVGRKPMPKPAPSAPIQRQPFQRPPLRQPMPGMQRQPFQRPPLRPIPRGPAVSENEKKTFRQMLEDLIGTKGAYILDAKLSILGKVPITELLATVKSLSSGIYAIVLDGPAERDLVEVADNSDAKYLVCTEAKSKGAKTVVMTADDLV
jgi:DNA primase